MTGVFPPPTGVHTAAPFASLQPPTLGVGRAVRLGAALRWRLTVNRLRKGGTTLFVLLMVGCVLLAASGFLGFAAGRALDRDGRQALFAVGFGVLVVGWTLVPLVGGGADETVDPTRLALLPLDRRRLLAVLGGAACSGPATIAVFFALCGVALGVPASGIGGWIVTVFAVPVVFLLGLGTARLGAALLVRAQRSRRGRDVAVLVSGVAGVSVWLASQAIGPLLSESEGRAGDGIVSVFSWFPPGWVGRALLAAEDGRPLVGAGWIAAAAAFAAITLAGWAAMTDRLLQSSERAAGPQLERRGAPLGGARTPIQAALAKELRYLLRSPSRRVQAMLGLLMGIGFSIIQVMAQTDDAPTLVLFGLWGMIIVLSAPFNLLGFDSGSLWLELVGGGPGRLQLFARSASQLPGLILPPVISIVAIAVWRAGWTLVPLALLLALTLALCALGAGAVVSVLAPVPQTDGDNPFAWRQGGSGKGCSTALTTFVGMAAVVVLAGPVVVPVLIYDDAGWAPLLAVGGVGWSALVWYFGIRWGARRLNGNEPELLAELSPRAVT